MATKNLKLPMMRENLKLKECGYSFYLSQLFLSISFLAIDNYSYIKSNNIINVHFYNGKTGSYVKNRHEDTHV